MKKLILLTMIFVSLFGGKAYSQYGGYTIDVGFIQSVRYEVGLMSALQSELILGESPYYGWHYIEPTEFSNGFSPIVYMSVSGEAKVAKDIFSLEYRLKLGYQKMNYKFVGDMDGVPNGYTYICDGSKVYSNISVFAELLLLDNNLRISAGAGLLAKFPLGVSMFGLDTPFPDMMDFGVNPEARVIYYFGDVYVSVFGGMEIGISSPYIGLSTVTGIRSNTTYIGFGVGYHINK